MRLPWDNAGVFRRKDLLADYREFTREMLLRFDRSQREFREEMRAQLLSWEESMHEWREEMRVQREEMRVQHEDTRAHLDRLEREVREQSRKTDEVIAEGQAQREALFAILDELRGTGGPAAAT